MLKLLLIKHRTQLGKGHKTFVAMVVTHAAGTDTTKGQVVMRRMLALCKVNQLSDLLAGFIQSIFEPFKGLLLGKSGAKTARAFNSIHGFKPRALAGAPL